MSTNPPGRKIPGLEVPATRSATYAVTETMRAISTQMTSVCSDTAPFLRRNLPAIIVHRSKGGTDLPVAHKQARAIAREFTVIAQLAKLIARLSVRARRKYDEYVHEAEQRAR